VQATYTIEVTWEETPAWVMPFLFVVAFTIIGLCSIIIIVAILGGGTFIAGYFVGRRYQLASIEEDEEERQPLSISVKMGKGLRDANPFKRKKYQRV
jgi:hypothetical protein